MATQITPEPNNPNPTPSLETPTPPTPTPASSNVDTTGSNDLFMAALREQTQRADRAEREARELRERSNTPADTTDPWVRFTGNPQELIQATVERTVAPLNDFVRRYERDQAISKLKQPFRSIPFFKAILDKAEIYVDQVLNNTPGEITLQVMQQALELIYAKAMSGQIQGLSFEVATPAIAAPTPRIVPPHNAPAVTPINRGPSPEADDKPWERMTETEKSMARYNGMTNENYYKHMHQEILTVSSHKPPTPAAK